MEGVLATILNIIFARELKKKGTLTSTLSAIFPFIFIWISLVLPLTFAELSLPEHSTSPLEDISDISHPSVWGFPTLGRLIVWEVAMGYPFLSREFRELESKASRFIAQRALKHSEWLCQKIPLLTQCSPYQPIRVIKKASLGFSDGIINGLWVGAFPYSLIGVFTLFFVSAVETLFRPQGLVDLLACTLCMITITVIQLFITLPLFALLIAITDGWLGYSIAFLIGVVVGLIGPLGLLKAVSAALSELPTVFREPLAGAILGTIVSGIIGDLIQPAPRIPFWALGAIIGAVSGIFTASFEKFFRALAELLENIVESAFKWATSSVKNAIKGMIEGMLVRAVLIIWQGGKIRLQDMLQNLKQEMPSLIVWGIFGLIIGVIAGLVSGTKKVRDQEGEKSA